MTRRFGHVFWLTALVSMAWAFLAALHQRYDEATFYAFLAWVCRDIGDTI